MPPLFTNPQSLTILNRIPYLGLSEYMAAPTGVDVDTLYVGGSDQEQLDGLAALIADASALADQFCFGQWGTIGASSNTEDGTYRVDRNGFVRFVCKTKPVLEVDSVATGPYPNQTATMDAATAAYIRLTAERVLFLPAWVSMASAAPSLIVPPATGDQAYVKVTYIAGFPIATLTGATGAVIAAGSTSLTISNTLGMYAGTQLRVYDATGYSETVTVQSVTDATHIALTAPTLYPHTIPAPPDTITVSALPPSVRRAVVLLTSSLIETRGDQSIILESMDTGHPKSATSEFPGSSGLVDDALELLAPFRVVR